VEALTAAWEQALKDFPLNIAEYYAKHVSANARVAHGAIKINVVDVSDHSCDRTFTQHAPCLRCSSLKCYVVCSIV
jgi:hypothetical protein